MTPEAAESLIIARVPRPMLDRAMEIFHHLTYSQTSIADVTYLRIPPDWPLRPITFRRNGRRFVMGLRGGTFFGEKA